MEAGGPSTHPNASNGSLFPHESSSFDWDDSSIQESPSLTPTSTTTTSATPASSTRRYSVAGVIRSLFHAVLVQDTEHLDHVLKALMLDPNKIRDKERKTMLMVAATENKHRVLRYLLTLPTIDVDLQDDEGETALYQAAAAGSTECVQLLILAGASAIQGNEEAITPLIIASYNGFASICRLLVTLGHVNVNQKDNTQKSALLLASYAGHVEIMAELIEHGAALDALDQYGWSSLMLAAYAGRLDACKLLLEHGADPHIKTSNGKNARSLSWDAGHKSIAVYISKFVAKGSSSTSLSLSRPMAQPPLPAPRSPSRRTHSPAPSLPSVPEEYQEDDNRRARYSFSGHASTVSRHSAISSRFTSPPTTLRRAPVITIPPPSSPTPEPNHDGLFPSGSQIATVINLATMFDEPTPEPAPLESNAEGPSHSIEISPEEPHEVPTTHPEEPWHHHRPMPSVHSMHKLRRKGIVPRYGSRYLTFSPATMALTDSEGKSLHSHRTSASERRNEQMKEGLHSHIHGQHTKQRRRHNRAWSLVTKLLTICCPPGLFPGDWTPNQIQDWRSKVTICILVATISILFGFLAFGFSFFTCRPHSTQTILASDFHARFSNASTGIDARRLVSIHGAVYDMSQLFEQGLHPPMPANISSTDLSKSLASRYGADLSSLFPPIDGSLNCQLYGAATSFGLCVGSASLNHCHNTSQTTTVLQSILRNDIVIQYLWDMISADRDLFVLDGNVLDVTNYLSQTTNSSITSEEKALMDWIRSMVGKDATLALQKRSDHKDLETCLVAHFKVGEIFGQTNGCVASIVVDSLALALWLLVALMRLGSALVYRWVLVRANGFSGKASEETPRQDTSILMLVRCREMDSEEDIKATLDSLTMSSLGSSQGLLVVVVESDVGGQSLRSNASQICRRLMETGTDPMDDKEGTKPDQLSRLSIDVPSLDPHDLERVVADQHQMFSGHYTVHSKRVPYILVTRSSPGGSSVHPSFRDTKRLIFKFLYRSFHDLPMSYFEFTLFEHIRQLTGQRPERYHFLLTTEVGTITDHGSLEKMCQTLENNERIMAACGQRLFQNQTENWLTRIQDYGNFLENQFGKSFESTLGAVQGLPDELCLIRIKMEPSLKVQDRTRNHKRNSGDISNMSDTDEDYGLGLGPTSEIQDDGEKDDAMLTQGKGKEMDDYRYSVPILVHPAVASVYCGSPKNTLHQRMMVSHSREDWFLTGLLHAAFPTRRIVYLPQATYRTRATTGFKIYLSLQRAEWNSRVHSLWEQMVSLQAPGTGIFRFWFHAISLLKLVLMPAMILFQWILIILVAVGASQGSNSTTLLDSPPAIIVLAFVTLAMIHQLILGVFLMRTGAMNLTGLGLMILTLPLRYLVVPLSALWSSEGMKTDIAGN
ncbi:hypothetical protein MVEG_02067 [Podila verticillata NRRL 6337]|nr:hypothetical protein MVEG_02067 [Podila verticillata NRRL 6337]